MHLAGVEKEFIFEEDYILRCTRGFPDGSVVKNLPANAIVTRDVGSVPGSGRRPRGTNDNLLQYSCLENSMDREA